MKPPRAKKPVERREDNPSSNPFDLWLARGLHKIYDDVANEPIPEDLLRLIEGDRLGSKDDEPEPSD